jgi:hypothetical protein
MVGEEIQKVKKPKSQMPRCLNARYQITQNQLLVTQERATTGPLSDA